MRTTAGRLAVLVAVVVVLLSSASLLVKEDYLCRTGQPAIVIVSFALGAIPFSNLLAQSVAETDLRSVGGGTVSGTALYRVAGFVPLAVGGIMDVAKAAPGVLAAGSAPVVGALAAGAAVAGHNWSPFLRGAGGRGVSPAMGALAVVYWPGAVLLLAGLAVGRVVRQTGAGVLRRHGGAAAAGTRLGRARRRAGGHRGRCTDAAEAAHRQQHHASGRSAGAHRTAAPAL